MIKVADTILNHIEGVINAAVTSMSNAMTENINNKIQIIKAVGRVIKTLMDIEMQYYSLMAIWNSYHSKNCKAKNLTLIICFITFCVIIFCYKI